MGVEQTSEALVHPDALWHPGLLKASFWSFNIGLALMALITLLPMGTLQLQAALEHGYWYARSAEFMGKPIIDVLVWMRMPGDLIFSVGALLLAWFVTRHWILPRIDPAHGGASAREKRQAMSQDVI